MASWMTSAAARPHGAASFPSVSHGSVLTFETVRAGEGDPAQLRLRVRHDTLVRVIDGVVRLEIGREERLLAVGEEAIVPAGAAHRLSAVAGEARFVSGLRAVG